MTILIRAGLPALVALTLLAGPAPAQDVTPPAATTTPAAPSAAAPAAPSNNVGEVFEIPRVGDREQQIELITGLCGVQMKKMSPVACKCLAEQALTSLSDPQRDYMIATVVAPPVADRMLNDGRVQQPDQEAIFRFISATSDGCATGTFDPAKAQAASMPPTPPAGPLRTPPSTPSVGGVPVAPATPTPAPAN